MDEDHIEIRFPKGKVKSKHIAIIVVFAVFLYFMSEALKSIFVEGLENPHYAVLIIALTLLVIAVVVIHIVRQLLEED